MIQIRFLPRSNDLVGGSEKTPTRNATRSCFWLSSYLIETASSGASRPVPAVFSTNEVARALVSALTSASIFDASTSFAEGVTCFQTSGGGSLPGGGSPAAVASLTAMALLVAIFRARPSPFYILDEVEAALDDINIDRFLQLVKRYSDRAQFIVVTHQKRTMEAADCLYGVSMAGNGVSKVISRRLPRDEAAAIYKRLYWLRPKFDQVAKRSEAVAAERRVPVVSFTFGCPTAEVVAIEADVELAERDLGLQEIAEQRAQSAGQQSAATMDAHDRQAVVLGVLLDDLVSDPHERAAHVVAVEDDLLAVHRLLPGLTGPG